MTPVLPVLHLFASDEWTSIVTALFHTLWIAALTTAGLHLILRRTDDPRARHRWSVAALLAVVLGGVIAWAVLQRRPTIPHPPAAAAAAVEATPTTVASAPALAEIPVATPPPVPTRMQWTPWFALLWLGGTVVMLTRAASVVIQAEALRRRCRPLADEALLKLVEQTRRQIGLTRRVQVLVTEQLTSPAVMGIIAPALLLPVSVVTTLPLEQLQLILLHELAHIRRDDYFVNLCQLVAESLLFFNPGVWWISRQIRQEREACCDAAAIACAGERWQYARTLVQVAGVGLAAAPAFGDRRNPSGLKDRVQRLLVPGYRPALRLTWRALTGSLGLGFILLTFCALGTRWTVAVAAQLLTPQQRMDRIEKTMTALGHPPESPDAQTEVRLTVRTFDGSPLPRRLQGTTIYHHLNSSGAGPLQYTGPGEAVIGKFGSGDLTIFLAPDGFAPGYYGPFDIKSSPPLKLEVTLQPGFPLPLALADADSGAAISNASLSVYFWNPQGSTSIQRTYSAITGASGKAEISHAAALPFSVKVQAPGYENSEQRFDAARAGTEQRVAVRRALPTGGMVLDRSTRRPIAGASIYQMSADMLTTDNSGRGYMLPRELENRVGFTDAQGRFALDQLVRQMTYGFLVLAPGHGGKILFGSVAGETNLLVEMGPELRLRGTVHGDLSQLETHNGKPSLHFRQSSRWFGRINYSRDGFVPVTVEGGTGHFDFTLEEESEVELSSGDATAKKEITLPVDDWEFTAGAPLATRKVDLVLQFDQTKGVPPRGTVRFTYFNRQRRPEDREIEITNGQARLNVTVGAQVNYRAGNLVGYSFSDGSVTASDQTSPQIIHIPVTPAGAIYVTLRNADGSPVGEAGCGICMLKPPPGLLVNGQNNVQTFPQDDGSRLFVQSTVALGGTYVVECNRGGNFTLSAPIELTEAVPERRVSLVLSNGVPIIGRLMPPAGRPPEKLAVTLDYNLAAVGWSFPALLKTTTDEQGRFSFPDAVPASGQFTVNVSSPGLQTAAVPVDFQKLPLTIELKPGLKLAGRLVEAKSGRPVVSAEVIAYRRIGYNWKQETTLADSAGNFSFDTLSPGDYSLSVPGALDPHWTDKTYRAGQSAPVVLKLTLDQNSPLQVAEKAP